MKDVKEIRRQLWYSLDMAYVKLYLFICAVTIPIIWLIARLAAGPYPAEDHAAIAWMLIIMSTGPILIFCAVRTWNIFRHPESYHFCKTKLCNPKGGSLRDTIKFTVLLEDADGSKFAADTHSIFHTHRSMFGPGFEDYVNQTVEAAYNVETGQVIIIG